MAEWKRVGSQYGMALFRFRRLAVPLCLAGVCRASLLQIFHVSRACIYQLAKVKSVDTVKVLD